MRKRAPVEDLSRRERQVMDILHRRGEATVSGRVSVLHHGTKYVVCNHPQLAFVK